MLDSYIVHANDDIAYNDYNILIALHLLTNIITTYIQIFLKCFQQDSFPFNRAALMNIGFLEAKKMADYGCYAFHDVDNLPANINNVYSCPSQQPRHMSVAVEKFNYG